MTKCGGCTVTSLRHCILGDLDLLGLPVARQQLGPGDLLGRHLLGEVVPKPGGAINPLDSCEIPPQVSLHVILRHTSTLGLRRSLWQRSKLRRETALVATPWGEVRMKLAFLGTELVRREPEYEDCRAIADAQGIPLRRVFRAAVAAAEAGEKGCAARGQ